jgi:hypothetical protein
MLHQRSIKKAIKRISDAVSASDIEIFRCETVKKRLDKTNKFRIFFIILLVVLSLNYVISTVLRIVLLFNNSEMTKLTPYQTFLEIARPVSILILFIGVGAYKMTSDAFGYFKILMQKCDELKVVSTKNKI